MKISIKLFVCAMLLTGFASCIDDESGEGGRNIPELVVAGDVDNMKVLNFNLGTECVVNPEITYKGGDEKNLTYTWSIGTYNDGIKGKLEEVGHERDLNYFFTKGGAYYAHLVVTDGEVGSVMDYQININRTFEEGYVLVSASESGEGNLAFIKVMTQEEKAAGAEQIRMEHCLSSMNKGLSESTLKNVVLGTITWPKTIHRIMASVEDKCYFLDPNTFTVISEIDYTAVFPGFKATQFVPDSYNPYAYDSKMKKFVHMDLEYMFGYEYGYYKGMSFDDIYLGEYTSWGSKVVKALFVKNESSEVLEFNAYAPYYGLSSYFPSTLDMLKDKKIVSCFIGTGLNSSYTLPVYIMAQSKTDAKQISLYSMNKGAYLLPDNFTEATAELSDDMAFPKQGTRFVASPKYNRHFYALDNKVYVMLMENGFEIPKKDNAAITFDANEEVTFINVNQSTEELYVATYDKTAKRGNFYIFDTADVRADNKVSAQPKESYKNCADKISNIFYKPRIS